MNSKEGNAKKLLIGVTGASGSIYAKMILDILQDQDQLQTEWVLSKTAEQVWAYELGAASYKDYSFRRFASDDLFAPPASGSAGYDAMIIIPCSMGTLGRIAHGVSSCLMTRAADVMIKERKKLILVTREAPLSKIHIQNMLQITDNGGIICPAAPGFYHHPETIDELLSNTIERVLSLAGFDVSSYRWDGPKQKKNG